MLQNFVTTKAKHLAYQTRKEPVALFKNLEFYDQKSLDFGKKVPARRTLTTKKKPFATTSHSSIFNACFLSNVQELNLAFLVVCKECKEVKKEAKKMGGKILH